MQTEIREYCPTYIHPRAPVARYIFGLAVSGRIFMDQMRRFVPQTWFCLSTITHEHFTITVCLGIYLSSGHDRSVSQAARDPLQREGRHLLEGHVVR